MTDYTKLIERLREYKDYIPATAETVDAIEALQKEVSTLDVLLEECKMDWSGDVTQIKAEHKREIQALQSQLGDAIQSSAHWQHQFTEAQTENDLLKGYRDRALELATAYNNAQENIEQINAHREHILAVNEKLTAQVDARGNGEPVSTGCRWCKHPAFIVGSSQKCPQCGKVFANAAPKALAPEPDMFWNNDDPERQHGSIEEFLNDEICQGQPVEVGAVYTIQQAKRLPNVQIKVTSIDEESCEAEYEVLAAHGIGGTP